MKISLLSFHFLIATAIGTFSMAQTPGDAQASPAVPAPSPPAKEEAIVNAVEITTPEAIAAREEFNKLPQEKKDAFAKLVNDGQGLLAQRRVTEALEKFNEAEGVYGLHPDLLNLKGAALVNLRDFDRASEYFHKSSKLYPGFWQTKFNLAEMYFVRKDWANGEKLFRELLAEEKKLDGSTRRLIDYKVILSLLKQKKVDEAKKLLANYDIYDDTPIFYYATAAMHFEKDERPQAEEWVTNARSIYSAQMNAIFEDSLTELGWLFVF